MNSKVIGLIPARMGSSRFYGKPIVNIYNKPMLYWVYDQAKKAKDLKEIYVVTPDLEILNKCKEFDIPCIYDKRQGSTAAQKLAFSIDKLDGDIYLNIQGDEPLLNPLAITQIINELQANTDSYYVGLISNIKNESEHNDRNVVKAVINANNEAMYFSRTPIPEKFEYGNAFRVLGLYGYRKWFLELFAQIDKSKLELLESGVEMLRMLELGYKIKLLKTKYETMGVDLPEHIPLIEKEIKKRKVLKQ